MGILRCDTWRCNMCSASPRTCYTSRCHISKSPYIIYYILYTRIRTRYIELVFGPGPWVLFLSMDSWFAHLVENNVVREQTYQYKRYWACLCGSVSRSGQLVYLWSSDPVNNVLREQTWQQQFKCILLSLQAAIAAISHQVFASIWWQKGKILM